MKGALVVLVCVVLLAVAFADDPVKLTDVRPIHPIPFRPGPILTPLFPAPTNPTDSSAHPRGNYVYRACHEDFKKYCPTLHPTSIDQLFQAPCYRNNINTFSRACVVALDTLKHGGNRRPPSAVHSGDEGKPSPSNPEGHAVGTPLYEACHSDVERFCPALSSNLNPAAGLWTEPDIFESSCFKKNLRSISHSCKAVYEKYMMGRSFLLGFLISSSVMILATSAIAMISICCCVACCIRVCIKRRTRRCTWTDAKIVDDVPEALEMGTQCAKSVNYDPLPQQQQEVFPQPQFVFPSQPAFSPYTNLPQYIVVPAEQQ